jgi:hypothetical protein
LWVLKGRWFVTVAVVGRKGRMTVAIGGGVEIAFVVWGEGHGLPESDL